jgi:hypothetical protein
MYTSCKGGGSQRDVSMLGECHMFQNIGQGPIKWLLLGEKTKKKTKKLWMHPLPIILHNYLTDIRIVWSKKTD